ncbi:MAG TPA: response regulator [Verrucomicrobiota bacterium]|jgi:DNA-binding NtrC family response regulator|nr:response regulator [Verrucomicrobiota bacterium]OQC24975.1 MAG: Transcriptional regulatory protein DegU [Verrucomicrobia bacterium ADurb.Bin063]HRR63502.1 response regulator [Candidatus Paceibacterota bacterium]MBP8014941.1 response regulator [Verrucomicrobiota bacterium]MDI9373706.1 response regulator [Verrucomicrobiota bacterium]
MASSAAASSGQAAKGRILIVDDEEGIRELLKALLLDRYLVSEADSGATLRQAFACDRPDVVLLDLKLPDANGLALLPVIKQQWPATEVIILTGQPDEHGVPSWATEAARGGAFSLVSKSAEFDCQKLLDGISLAMLRSLQARGEHAPSPGA